MKRLKKLVLLLTIMIPLTACGTSGYGQTKKITDSAKLDVMNQMITQATKYYFDVEVPQNIPYAYESFESYIPSSSEKEKQVHQSNIFQALASVDVIEGDVSSYGGVLSPDNQKVTGLILNVYHEKTPPKAYTNKELQHIALKFLTTKNLVKTGEIPSYTGINEKGSSTYITVLNFTTPTHRMAVGVNLQFGTIVYFEHAPAELFNK